jgi:hypothetical protein
MLALAALVGSACNETDPVASNPADSPEAPAQAVPLAANDSVVPNLLYSSGRLFGPINLWSSSTDVKWGPAPFTGSKNPTGAGSIVTQIGAARQMKQRLVLSMTDGKVSDYMTDGKFDMAKWKKKMNTFNTSTIRNAVAAAISDGTVVGNQLVDEPETKKYNGSLTKATIDQMAVYAKSIFPTLPMGVNVGPPGYRWRSSEHYQKLDFVRYQYAWYITSGDVAAWRSAVLNQAKLDGVTPALSINILNGGLPDRVGSWDCTGTGGKGTKAPLCRVTPDQLRTFGQALVGAGCFLTLWWYDGTFMSKSANQDAFQDIASTARGLSLRSCKRP